MPALQTTYLGHQLENPVIAGASTFTGSVEKVKALADSGVGGVVLRSIFEEQIQIQMQEATESLYALQHAEAYEYLMADVAMRMGPAKYLDLIRQSKEAVSVPVFASINGITQSNWIEFSRQIEAAGADGLELNIYDIPHSADVGGQRIEERHVDLVAEVCSQIKIPVAVKIGSQYSSIPSITKQFEAAGAKAIVLFNRFFRPAIDLDTLTLKRDINLSHKGDAGMVIRWIALLRMQIACNLCMSGGVFSADEAIMGILVGANVFQICSALYEDKSMNVVEDIKSGMLAWMERQGFDRLEDFRSRLCEPKDRPSLGFSRAQYVQTLVEQSA